MEEKIESKKINSVILILDYFIQGMNGSVLTTIMPIYLITTLGTIGASSLALLTSLIGIPTILKILFGALGDKGGIKKIGRKKTWIIVPDTLSGIIWIIIAFLLMMNPLNAVAIFAIGGFIVFVGVYFSDTAFDGLMLSLYPKEELARIQGNCWAGRAAGMIAGGPIALFILPIFPVPNFLICLGIATIICTSLVLLIEEPIVDKISLKSDLKLIFTDKNNLKFFLFLALLLFFVGALITLFPIYLLLQAGLIEAENASSALVAQDLNLYDEMGIISTVTFIALIIGSVGFGIIADKKSRRLVVFTSLIFGTFFAAIQMISSSNIIFLMFLAIFSGIYQGVTNISFASISGALAQKYPEAKSTYFAICTTVCNIGSLFGLVVIGILFSAVSGGINDTIFAYGVVFLIMMLITDIAIVPFLLMKRSEYELNLEIK